MAKLVAVDVAMSGNSLRRIQPRCDECGDRAPSVRYIDDARRCANVCRKCVP